jgi:ribonuclease P protein component
VLPAANRLRRSTDFASVVQTGRRSRSGPLVVHQQPELGFPAPLVGFVVGKSVGGSVVRHRVARRLRAQMSRRLADLPAGSGTVVRALPAAADATSEQLGEGLDRAFAKLAVAL